MGEITIRDLTDQDLEAITTINNANVPAVGEADRAKLAHIAGQAIVALSAVTTADDGTERVVGFCLVLGPGAEYSSVNYLWFGEHYDEFAYVDRIAFDASAQGRGAGAQMYRAVLERIDAPVLCAEVNLRPRNDGSLRFHAREGFVEVGQLETDYGVLVSLLARELPGR